MSLPEDTGSHTEADAARYERERAIDAGEDDRPTRADVWEPPTAHGAVILDRRLADALARAVDRMRGNP